MQRIKISIITVVYNAQNTIVDCLKSVMRQKFDNVEYIVIDGGSIDDTLNLLNYYRENINILISEPDKGIYDAMNKGIALATGDIIGMLNADDYFADEAVLGDIAQAFETARPDILYADLDFVDRNGRVVRKWRSGAFRSGLFSRGWMPPHPTFYCSRALFEKLGSYKLDYGSAADYELMLRFMHAYHARVYYLNRVTIKMITGGVSNKNLKNRIRAMRFDFKAMRANGIRHPLITLIKKPLRKIMQFF